MIKRMDLAVERVTPRPSGKTLRCKVLKRCIRIVCQNLCDSAQVWAKELGLASPC